MDPIDRYIRDVLKNVEGSMDEKTDMAEEMKIHLELAKEEYIKQGIEEKDAILKALKDFGREEAIGDEMQMVVAPYTKELLFSIAILSTLFAIGAFLHGVVVLSEFHPMWLMAMVTLSGFTFYIAFFPSFVSKRVVLTNVLLVAYFPLIFIGLLIIDTTDKWYKGPLDIITLFNSIFIILFIFLSTIRSSGKTTGTPVRRNQTIAFHIVNIIAGISVIPQAFLTGFGMLVFGGFSWRVFTSIGYCILWAILYWLQIRFLSKGSKLAFFFHLLTWGVSILSLSRWLIIFF